MNITRAVITGIVLAVLFVLIEYLVHGVMLNGIYMQTSSIWRPQADMMQMMYLLMAGEAIFGFFFGIIFAAGYDFSKPACGQGFRYGLLMACLIAPFSALSWYVILPIPANLAVYWFIADFVTMLVLGVVAGMLYKAR